MPVMNGLQATRIIRSFEETGTWEAAQKAGVELNESSLQNGHASMPSTKRTPIIAVSLICLLTFLFFNFRNLLRFSQTTS